VRLFSSNQTLENQVISIFTVIDVIRMVEIIQAYAGVFPISIIVRELMRFVEVIALIYHD